MPHNSGAIWIDFRNGVGNSVGWGATGFGENVGREILNQSFDKLRMQFGMTVFLATANT
jgi:hypothetical protein